MPDVENQQRLVLVNIRKVQADLIDVSPNGVAGCLVPPQQFCGRIRVKSRVPLDGGRAEFTPHARITRACSPEDLPFVRAQEAARAPADGARSDRQRVAPHTGDQPAPVVTMRKKLK